MKKKISPIKLHNLSEAEMETRELNLLRGGSGTGEKCPCVSICSPKNCTCMSAGLSNVLKEINNNYVEKGWSDSALEANTGKGSI